MRPKAEWAIDSEPIRARQERNGRLGERNNCFSKIQLVGQKNIETKHLSLVKAIVLVFKAGAFRYLVGYNK